MLRPIDVAPGVQAFPARTPTLPPATHTNSYALGEQDVLLVEPATPYEDERAAWLDWARGLRSNGRNLVGIFLTHHHADHVGGAEVFARELELPIRAHEKTAARLPALRVSRLLAEGEVITLDGPNAQAWDVLHTPGHAPGHLCLHEASSGYLVAGDMVASEGTILVEPVDGDMRAYMAQLERLRALGCRVALPAHGAPILEPEALFTRYLLHRRAREEKILRALGAHGTDGATAGELVPTAYDDAPQSIWPFAQMSLAAHLVKLDQDGVVSRSGDRYRARTP